jgi:hypothetical protein
VRSWAGCSRCWAPIDCEEAHLRFTIRIQNPHITSLFTRAFMPADKGGYGGVERLVQFHGTDAGGRVNLKILPQPCSSSTVRSVDYFLRPTMLTKDSNHKSWINHLLSSFQLHSSSFTNFRASAGSRRPRAGPGASWTCHATLYSRLRTNPTAPARAASSLHRATAVFVMI